MYIEKILNKITFHEFSILPQKKSVEFQLQFPGYCSSAANKNAL